MVDSSSGLVDACDAAHHSSRQNGDEIAALEEEYDTLVRPSHFTSQFGDNAFVSIVSVQAFLQICSLDTIHYRIDPKQANLIE
jgi:hypothetical protein